LEIEFSRSVLSAGRQMSGDNALARAKLAARAAVFVRASENDIVVAQFIQRPASIPDVANPEPV